MKLDTIYDRHKVIDALIKKAFKLDALWARDPDNADDWVANMEILRNLVSIDDMIRVERILSDAFDEMENVRTRNIKEKEIYLGILYENTTQFIDTILLHILEFSFDNLNDWHFKTEVGQKFRKEVGKKLEALIKKYQDLYDL